MHITVAGQRGSFSHAAGELYAIGQGFTPIEFSYAIDSIGVLKALTTNKHIDFGIMPIYNSGCYRTGAFKLDPFPTGSPGKQNQSGGNKQESGKEIGPGLFL